MAKQIRTHQDGGKVSELRSFLLHLLTADPSSPTEGLFYQNTTSHITKIHNGTSFLTMATLANKITDFTAPTTSLAMNTQKITSMLAGTAATDGATLTNKITDFAAPTGSLPMNAQKITGVGTGTAATDGATLSNKVTDFATPTSNFAMGSNKITGITDGTAASDAATYGQLLVMMNGSDWKNSVRVIMTTNVTISNPGTLTYDGVVMTAGDTNPSILLTGQTAPSENGVYIVGATTATALVRRTDADGAGELTDMATFGTDEGTHAGEWWQLTTNNPISLGSTGLVFIKIGQGTTYVGGAGITLTGATFDVVAASGSGLIVNADNIDVDPVNGLPVNRGGTGGITAAAAKTNLGFTTKATGLIGDGAALTYAVTHGLGSQWLTVQVYEVATLTLVDVDIVLTNSTTFTVNFIGTAPAANTYRWIATG